MKWIKKGLIFNTKKEFFWNRSHAQIPLADKINNEKIRIYYATRDKNNRSYASFIEVDANNPKNILYIHDKPVLTPGELGCFDDSGAMPSHLINFNGRKYLYYIGWNRGTTVPYCNTIGLAISEDNGITFKKMFKGPIIGRNKHEPYFVATPFILIEKKIWKMWYLSSTGWVIINNKPEPLYNIKYAESEEGIDWKGQRITCIDYKFNNEAISRPCVINENDFYRMWYSYRGSLDYRINKETSYRIGYAESKDGINWTRMDSKVGIDVSIKGWDYLMIEYPFVYKHNEIYYMLYNGNGFGESGFGYAIAEG